ncbi:type VI secretion system-associated FHA domain protein TagH [Variovorax sp. J22G73]|uniref:type VI secretion system-associated FHA domain protein TagH n=1 Tax=unclassified Variovorax TaxID=663243 RepID=UPI000D5EFE08|nr:MULTISPECIES: type VI secretion system-associated FHA domain protein TagH [unclassified Variovorax]MDM0007446.1 type VI secretion system-associated FHA domain protein TagH [Variovorax sp. J22R203]MDM0100195.1 type VI secretion system-associated FHA domain protein TagH [Variovorax sp. J22G73]
MRWTVIEHAGSPVTAGPSAWLAAPGGTIGRSPDNHLVLPDVQRQISRLQATVRFDEDGAAVLRNMSAVLPIGVNGRTLAHEQESRVADGDRVTIGSYVLEAASAQHASAAQLTVMVAPAPPAALQPSIQPPVAPSQPAFAAPIAAPLAAPLPSSPIGDLLPASSGNDVFADLFGEGALPIGDAQPAAAVPPMRQAPDAVAAPVAQPMPAHAATPSPAVHAPAHSPTFPTTPPAAFVPALASLAAPAQAPVQAPAPTPAAAPPRQSSSAAASQMPSAADWDAILANAPRRVDSTPAPMPDPMAHEPFELPSQARRNPVDPLAELNPHAADDMSNIAMKRGVDPLSFFAADDSAHSPLADPRPTALAHHDTLLPGEAHPALDLLHDPKPVAQGYSHSNHAREMSAQFRPPMPVTRPVPSPAHSQESLPAPAPVVAPVKVEAPPPPPPPPPAPLPPAPAPVAAAPVVQPPAAIAPPDVAQIAAPAAVPAALPAAAPVEAPPTTTPAAAAPTPASSSSEALFKAFLEGAGVPELAGQQPMDLEAMQRLGRIMRAFTDGTIELLSSRAMLKREVRAEITMIVDEENNPFKILPNGRAVLMQMFGARMPGFLPPEAAVHDALGDLQSHQLGMVAGMRAALLTLLKSFDPAVLARDTPHDGGLGEKLLPGGREARLWRRLQALHTETTAAVEDDFQAVFGRAFQQAYDKEMERLKEARRG